MGLNHIYTTCRRVKLDPCLSSYAKATQYGLKTSFEDLEVARGKCSRNTPRWLHKWQNQAKAHATKTKLEKGAMSNSDLLHSKGNNHKNTE